MAIVGMIWYGNATSKPGGKEKIPKNIPPSSPEEKLPLSSLVGERDVDEEAPGRP